MCITNFRDTLSKYVCGIIKRNVKGKERKEMQMVHKGVQCDVVKHKQ